MSDKNYDKVILPIIRRIMPDLIARDIMGVSGGFNGRLSGTEHIKPYDLGGDKTYESRL